jgi:hypothetical protein
MHLMTSESEASCKNKSLFWEFSASIAFLLLYSSQRLIRRPSLGRCNETFNFDFAFNLLTSKFSKAQLYGFIEVTGSELLFM